MMLHLVKEDIMAYERFVDKVKEEVQQQMGEEFEVKLLTVIKNNGHEWESMVVTREGKTIAPAIYLKAYYDSYLNGTVFEELVYRLRKIYEHCSIPYLEEGFEFSFELMKSYIYYRLVNYRQNEAILKEVPHLKFLDLAITFHCLVRNDEDGIGSIRITNEHIKQWDVQLDDIKKLSMVNTPQLFPAVIKSMEDMLEDLLGLKSCDEIDLLNDVELRNISLDHTMQDTGQAMYVLTNQKGINGASCLLYPGIIREFSLKVNSDLVILPSSIHEVILLPVKGNIKKKCLMDIVNDVNQSQVLPEEYLSNEIYFYIKDKNVFRK